MNRLLSKGLFNFCDKILITSSSKSSFSLTFQSQDDDFRDFTSCFQLLVPSFSSRGYCQPCVEENIEGYVLDSSRLKDLIPSTKNKALVSCGCFNPPTYAHLRNFESAKSILEADHGMNILGGFISPASDGYGKKGLTPSIHRMNMLELSVSSSDLISVDSWEVQENRFVRTKEVLMHFEEELGDYYGQSWGENDCSISLLCGSDLLDSMVNSGSWVDDHLEYILGQHGLVVIDREGFDVDTIISGSEILGVYQDNIYRVPAMIKNDISSTLVRKFVKKGYSTKYYIPDSVRVYIDENDLYS